MTQKDKLVPTVCRGPEAIRATPQPPPKGCEPKGCTRVGCGLRRGVKRDVM